MRKPVRGSGVFLCSWSCHLSTQVCQCLPEKRYKLALASRRIGCGLCAGDPTSTVEGLGLTVMSGVSPSGDGRFCTGDEFPQMMSKVEVTTGAAFFFMSLCTVQAPGHPRVGLL